MGLEGISLHYQAFTWFCCVTQCVQP